MLKQHLVHWNFVLISFKIVFALLQWGAEKKSVFSGGTASGTRTLGVRWAYSRGGSNIEREVLWVGLKSIAAKLGVK